LALLDRDHLSAPADAEDQRRRHHLLIAGTGRAGTSALVRYLTGLGLDTHLSRRGEASFWDEEAQAGLEDIPLSVATRDPPYVIKSPWSYQVAREMLDDPEIALDGAILPVRDLIEAAASRSIREFQALHQNLPWLANTASTWEHWGTTPGGAIYSLNPTDIARLLAVGFHQLVERLIQADVPLVLLAFPRFATDPDYLHRTLAPVLPVSVPAAQARAVHAATFKAEKVRVMRELGAPERPGPVEKGIRGPNLRELEKAALSREIARLRKQLDAAMAGQNGLEPGHDALRERLERMEARAAEAEAAREAATIAAERERARAADQLLRERAGREREEREKARLAEEILALRASRSWRLTRPLRALRRLAKG
jgi:hypothetical protein